jgi:hypothetical protein
MGILPHIIWTTFAGVGGKIGNQREQQRTASAPQSRKLGTIVWLKKTLPIDKQLLDDAGSASGTGADTDTVRLGLEAGAARRLRSAAGASRIRTSAARGSPPVKPADAADAMGPSRSATVRPSTALTRRR